MADEMLLLPQVVHVSMKEVGDVEAAISRSRDRNLEITIGEGIREEGEERFQRDMKQVNVRSTCSNGTKISNFRYESI
jgi:hypothetical protein